MQVKFVNVKGIQTRCLFEGSGYPLLLIHGGGIGSESWYCNIDELAKHYYVIAPDLVYHGFTGPKEYQGGAPLQDIIDHLVDFVEVMGLEKLAVAGSSLGALLATHVYFNMPERVEKLILIGSGSSFNTAEQSQRTRSESIQNAMTAISNPTLESCRKRMGNICYDPTVVPDEMLLSQMTNYALPGFAETHERVRRAMIEPGQEQPFRIDDRIEQIKIPTLVITGREDPRAIYESTVEGAKRLPNGRLVTVEKCGHLPYIEHPELFHQEVLKFMKEGS